MDPDLDLVGDFENPFSTNVEKVRAIRARRWSPDAGDFTLFVTLTRKANRQPIRTVQTVGSAGALLALLYAEQKDGRFAVRKDRSIRRINLVTHGAESSVGLRGSVKGGVTTWSDDVDPSYGGIDPSSVRALHHITLTVGGKAQKIPIAAIKKKLAKNAQFFLYACKSGQAPTRERSTRRPLLKALATLLGVQVYGFLHDIEYEASNPSSNDVPPEKLRWRLCLASGPTSKECTKTANLRELDKLADKLKQLLYETP